MPLRCSHWQDVTLVPHVRHSTQLTAQHTTHCTASHHRCAATSVHAAYTVLVTSTHSLPWLWSKALSADDALTSIPIRSLCFLSTKVPLEDFNTTTWTRFVYDRTAWNRQHCSASYAMHACSPRAAADLSVPAVRRTATPLRPCPHMQTFVHGPTWPHMHLQHVPACTIVHHRDPPWCLDGSTRLPSSAAASALLQGRCIASC